MLLSCHNRDLKLWKARRSESLQRSCRRCVNYGNPEECFRIFAVGVFVVQASLNPGDSVALHHLTVIEGSCIGTFFISALSF